MNRQRNFYAVLQRGIRDYDKEQSEAMNPGSNAIASAPDAAVTIGVERAIGDRSSNPRLARIAEVTAELDAKYHDQLIVDLGLSRKVVSFQANKRVPLYRWYKYKEGYSAELVSRFIAELELPIARVLDPFAGAGTTMFVAAARGFDADGIELLPVGQEIVSARSALHHADLRALSSDVDSWAAAKPWALYPTRKKLHQLRITSGAYSPETEACIERYLAALEEIADPLQSVLRLALLSVLETVSYTRKDGQYLRWDQRSPRQKVRGSFHKGPIPSFDFAVSAKLSEIAGDLAVVASTGLSEEANQLGRTRLFRGSCLNVLPTLDENSYGAIITSPPYCNRYDYTRTYALEHALLGQTESEVSELRQLMLTCTVENREKALTSMNPAWERIVEFAGSMSPLAEILTYLEELASRKELNNTNIPRMIRGYFSEMACVIYESARVLARGGYVVMVNDNVRYAGANIHVDTILSDIAQQVGLTTERILISPQNKGNSSQQMGAHGREPLRKSVYVWRKV